MKKKILLLMLTLGFLGCISAQTVHSPLNHTIVKTEWAGEKTSIKTYDGGRIKIVKKDGEDETPHETTFMLNFNQTNQQLDMMYIFNKQIQATIGGFPSDMSTIPMYLPSGTYDIAISFKEIDETTAKRLYTKYVIHEQVTIDCDTILYFAAREAKNHITIKTLTFDGEPVSTGKWHLEDDGTMTCIEEGNTDDVFGFNYIYCMDYGLLNGAIGPDYVPSYNFGVLLDTDPYNKPLGEMRSDFYVNDVSERIIFNANRIACCGNSFYTSNYEMKGCNGDTTITNDPSEFKLYSDTFEKGRVEDAENCSHLAFYVAQPGAAGGLRTIISNSEPLAKDEPINLYLGASPDISCYPLFPIVQAGITYFSGEYQPWGEPIYSQRILSAPLTNIGGEAVIANNGIATANDGFSFYLELSDEVDAMGQDNRQIPLFPTHPSFTYSVDKKNDELANCCPMLLTNTSTIYGFELAVKHTGRYGEWASKFNDFKYVGKNNGNVFLDSEDEQIILSQPSQGDIDIDIVLDDIVVDDIPASNKCSIHYIIESEDNNSPTLTNLQFKNSDDIVTDRFSSSHNGVLEFLAGDFNFRLTPLNNWYWDRVAPESVEVSYSPYGEDNWNELTVEEIPENYWPLLGWFYRGSLAGVTGEAYEGWFDLKIRLTDAAGNWQEQILSPAFRIDNLAYSSVATITPACKNGDNAIYNLAGQRMRGDLNSLPHGIYIVNGKKVVK